MDDRKNKSSLGRGRNSSRYLPRSESKNSRRFATPGRKWSSRQQRLDDLEASSLSKVDNELSDVIVDSGVIGDTSGAVEVLSTSSEDETLVKTETPFGVEFERWRSNRRRGWPRTLGFGDLSCRLPQKQDSVAARRRIRTSSSCEDDQDASAIVPALHPSESSDNAEAEVRKADKSSEFETSDGIDEIPTSPDKTMKRWDSFPDFGVNMRMTTKEEWLEKNVASMRKNIAKLPKSIQGQHHRLWKEDQYDPREGPHVKYTTTSHYETVNFYDLPSVKGCVHSVTFVPLCGTQPSFVNARTYLIANTEFSSKKC